MLIPEKRLRRRLQPDDPSASCVPRRASALPKIEKTPSSRIRRTLDDAPDQAHNFGMPAESGLFDPTILPAAAPFTPGERQLLASFVAKSLHGLGSTAIERILVFGSRARGGGGEY
jgi:hypothetical protein